jgi:PPOX class probable F420-dependent enzyme
MSQNSIAVCERKDIAMDLAEAQQFLRDHHRAILATWRRDGRIQLSPIAVGIDAEGRAIVSSRETAYKTKNLRRQARASLCVFVDGFYGPWVQVDGTAEVVSLPQAMELLVDYYRRVAGEHPDWDDYRRAMEREQRVLIRITMESAGPDRKG